MRRPGIDVSEHSGILDRDMIEKGGAEFATTRPSWEHSGEDKQFRRDIRKCERVKMPYGLYHYFYVANDARMREEASGFIRLCKTCKPGYSCYIDMEDVDGRKWRNGVSNAMNMETCYYTCRELEKAGFYAGIYANLDWPTNHINSFRLNRLDKWVAQWASVNTYRKLYGMWQFTSDGSIHGYNDRMDLDYVYEDYPAITEEKGLNGCSKAPDQPKPDPKLNPSKNPKYKVGTPVTYTGLRTQANGGNWYPRRLLAVEGGIITCIIKGAEYPHLINDGTGWTNDYAADDEPTRPSEYWFDASGRGCRLQYPFSCDTSG